MKFFLKFIFGILLANLIYGDIDLQNKIKALEDEIDTSDYIFEIRKQSEGRMKINKDVSELQEELKEVRAFVNLINKSLVEKNIKKFIQLLDRDVVFFRMGDTSLAFTPKELVEKKKALQDCLKYNLKCSFGADQIYNVLFGTTTDTYENSLEAMEKLYETPNYKLAYFDYLIKLILNKDNKAYYKIYKDYEILDKFLYYHYDIYADYSFKLNAYLNFYFRKNKNNQLKIIQIESTCFEHL